MIFIITLIIRKFDSSISHYDTQLENGFSSVSENRFYFGFNTSIKLNLDRYSLNLVYSRKQKDNIHYYFLTKEQNLFDITISAKFFGYENK